MKKIIIVSLLLNNLIFSGIGQTVLKFGKFNVDAKLVNKETFNIYDSWRIIYREYIVEKDNSNDFILLNEKMKDEYLEIYNSRRKQGELIYGSIVRISKEAFEPFCPYMDAIVLNPNLKKNEKFFDSGEFDIFPQLRGKKMLNIELWCPQKRNIDDDSPDVYIDVLNENLIMISYDNSYTFLERIKNPIEREKQWNIDNYGFNTAKFRGKGELEILLNWNDVKKDDNIFFYMIKRKLGNNNNVFVSYKLAQKSICATSSVNNYIYAQADSLKNQKSYALSLFKSNDQIVKIWGITDSQSEEWEAKWKVVNRLKKIKQEKVFIFLNPDKVTKMYLVKGDEVEILEKIDNWFKVRYYGKKIIEGWIKQVDIY